MDTSKTQTWQARSGDGFEVGSRVSFLDGWETATGKVIGSTGETVKMFLDGDYRDVPVIVVWHEQEKRKVCIDVQQVGAVGEDVLPSA